MLAQYHDLSIKHRRLLEQSPSVAAMWQDALAHAPSGAAGAPGPHEPRQRRGSVDLSWLAAVGDTRQTFGAEGAPPRRA